MNIQQLCLRIDDFLDGYPNVKAFKIGKTDNIEERCEKYNAGGYQFVWQLALGECNRIGDAEKLMIKYFKEKSRHKDVCKNEIEGGGNPNADKLYIALMKTSVTIDELHNDESLIDQQLPIRL